MNSDIRAPRLVIIIIDRKEAGSLVKFLNEKGCMLHFAMNGRGTAPTEIQTVLGIGETEKTVLMLSLPSECLEPLYAELRDGFQLDKGKGIAFDISISSIGNMKTLKFITELSKHE